MNYTSSDSNRSSNVPWRGYFCRLNITIVSILICFKLIVQFAKYIYEECKIWIKRYLLLRRYLVKLLFYLIRRLHKQSQSYLDNVMHTHTPSSPHPFPKKKKSKADDAYSSISYFCVFRNPATFLHAYTCLPLAYATRQAAGAILQDVADSGVLFAILMCKHKVLPSTFMMFILGKIFLRTFFINIFHGTI